MVTFRTYLQKTKLSILLSLAVLNLCCGGGGADNPVPTPTPTGSSPPPQGLPAQCLTSDVSHYDLPIYWGRPDSPKFTYYFQFQKATSGDSSTAPIGILINGGAGAPSIGFPQGKLFPPTYNVINTDVRGVGCNINSSTPFKSDALTTEYFARDVLSIVQVLRMTQYVLFGVSYGTVQATVMANIARNEGIQTPTALVLEGILGKWQLNTTDVVALNKEWLKATPLIPASVVTAISQSSEPFGIPTKDWATFLTQTLNAGTTPTLGNATAYYLAPLGSADQNVVAQAKSQIQGTISQFKTETRPETIWLATVLHCTETEGSVYATDFVNGRFVETGPDVCPSLGLSFVRPYDSAQYPVNVPIYYFEGADDPDTIPENATYHFDHQTQADRVFTLVGSAGHTALSGTLRETGCTPAIFNAVAFNPSGVDAAIQQCGWPVTITMRGAGQDKGFFLEVPAGGVTPPPFAQ
jgi:proline iminopeptidase